VERTVVLTVVVVDDSAEHREIVRYLLERTSDMKIIGEAADGQEGLNVVLRERPDVVITDLVMPNLNGVELTRRIRRELPGTMLILVSSLPDYRLLAPDSEADVFVSKWVMYDTLLPAIRDLVARRGVLASALPQTVTQTLGDVLYANRAKVPVSEREWGGLVQATAGGDRSALHALYTRTHRIVFTLIVRITNNLETAEELMGDVFHDVWRRASEYDPTGGSVVRWIMNQARDSAIVRITDHADRAQISTIPSGAMGPSGLLWERLEQRIATETGQKSIASPPHGPPESDWEEVAPGISCNLLATDSEKGRVSMLVRLAPGTAYPPHRHADVEELYLLDGDLMINDKLLHPGDYNRAEPGTSDQRVWSETGCMCILLTSIDDILN